MFINDIREDELLYASRFLLAIRFDVFLPEKPDGPYFQGSRCRS